ncbi:TPA: hypothetical protein ACUI9Q_005412 [Klebsiella pneumoniae]
MNNKLHSELIKKAMFPDLGCSEFRELTARKAMRITPMRMMVYHFIRCAEDKGISAYQILDQLKSYNPNWPSSHPAPSACAGIRHLSGLFHRAEPADAGGATACSGVENR